jgi:hypothetical protein
VLMNHFAENLIDLFGDFLTAHGDSRLDFLPVLVDDGHRMELFGGDQQLVVRQFDRQGLERLSDPFDIVDGQRQLDEHVEGSSVTRSPDDLPRASNETCRRRRAAVACSNEFRAVSRRVAWHWPCPR